MYNHLLRIGHFTITTYGVILALAVVAGATLLARGFRERGLPDDDAWSVLTYALVGGIVGAKLYFLALHPGLDSLLSRGGLVWYGGLIGGAAGVALAVHRKRLGWAHVADALAPAAALGHAIGHIGCFFSGDSYGLPSNLPWAVAFPQGMPPTTAGNLRREFGVRIPASVPDSALLRVHPTMLYASLALLIITAFLWWYRRRSITPGRLFGIYLVLEGTERFLVEFLRAKDDRFLWGFSTAQGVAVVVALSGVALLWLLWRRGAQQGAPARLAPATTGARATP